MLPHDERNFSRFLGGPKEALRQSFDNFLHNSGSSRHIKNSVLSEGKIKRYFHVFTAPEPRGTFEVPLGPKKQFKVARKIPARPELGRAKNVLKLL
jgi:hypothetical protein